MAKANGEGGSFSGNLRGLAPRGLQETFAALAKALPNYRYVPDEEGGNYSVKRYEKASYVIDMLRSQT